MSSKRLLITNEIYRNSIAYQILDLFDFDYERYVFTANVFKEV